MSAPEWPGNRARRRTVPPPPPPPAPIALPARHPRKAPVEAPAKAPVIVTAKKPSKRASKGAPNSTQHTGGIAPSAIRENAEIRIRQLRGQIRQDCEALANTASRWGTRIAEGEVPRHDAEFMTIALMLAANCTALATLMRLIKS